MEILVTEMMVIFDSTFLGWVGVWEISRGKSTKDKDK